MKTRLLLGLGLVGTLALLGCRGNPNTAVVKGTVTYKGKPVPAGSVLFYDDHDNPENGKIGPDGQYTLRARIGMNKVAVFSREPRIDSTDPRIPPPPPKSRIPWKYEDTRKSGLSLEVKPGENKADFDLQD